MVKKIDASKLEESIYASTRLSKGKLIALFIFSLLIFVGINLSFTKRLTEQLEKVIKGTPQCPIIHKGIAIEWLLPKIVVKAPSLSASCFNRRKGGPLKLEDVAINLGIPSVYPPGIKLHGEIKPIRGKSRINLYPIIGLTSHFIKISNTVIDDQLLAEIFGKSIIEGMFEIESNLQVENSELANGDLLIKSKNLIIRSQNIQGLNLPQLRIGNFQVKANLNKTKLSIISLIIGDDQSPIYLSLSGNIRLNKYNVASSKLELAGDIRFSPDFITAFPAINLFLSGKESQGGMYRIEIGGSFNAPSPRIL